MLAGRLGRALVVIINSTTLTYQTSSKHEAEEEKAYFYMKGETMNIICEVFSALLKGEIEVFYSPGQGG